MTNASLGPTRWLSEWINDWMNQRIIAASHFGAAGGVVSGRGQMQAGAVRDAGRGRMGAAGEWTRAVMAQDGDEGGQDAWRCRQSGGRGSQGITSVRAMGVGMITT